MGGACVRGCWVVVGLGKSGLGKGFSGWWRFSVVGGERVSGFWGLVVEVVEVMEMKGGGFLWWEGEGLRVWVWVFVVEMVGLGGGRGRWLEVVVVKGGVIVDWEKKRREKTDRKKEDNFVKSHKKKNSLLTNVIWLMGKKCQDS